jgi:hypothetical protein
VAPIIERIGSGCASNPMRVLIRLTAPLDEFAANLTSFNETKHHVFHLMQSGDELHAIVIRNAEILTQDAADGVNWLDGQRHLLQEFDAENKHTIPLSGDLLYSSIK